VIEEQCCDLLSGRCSNHLLLLLVLILVFQLLLLHRRNNSLILFGLLFFIVTLNNGSTVATRSAPLLLQRFDVLDLEEGEVEGGGGDLVVGHSDFFFILL